MNILYVYAVTRPGVLPEAEGIDGLHDFGAVADGNVAAVYTLVAAEQFSQEAIDSRAGDLEWLGAIGYRHQEVMSDLMRSAAVVPLRAFTLFSTPEALQAYLRDHREMLGSMLARLDGKREWTVRIEFDPERWRDALVGRVPALAALQDEIDAASPGKGFLLRKKLEEERKSASREAEQALVAEVEEALSTKLGCETVAESRQLREGAFPQINVLLERDEESRLQEVSSKLADRYRGEGVELAITGPWPPYTFAVVPVAGAESRR